MKQLTILVGLAASGKSTIASKMEQKGAIIVSSDACNIWCRKRKHLIQSGQSFSNLQ